MNTDLEKRQAELLIAFTNFFQVASQMEPNKRNQPGVCGDWSPKEVLSHLIGWDQSMRAFIVDPDNFDPPYDVHAFNAQSVSERQFQIWEETVVELQTRFQGLQKATTAVTPEMKIYNRVISWLKGRREDYEFHTSQFETWVA